MLRFPALPARGLLVAASACSLLTPDSLVAENTLWYRFEDLAEFPVDFDEVLNSAPAALSNGELINSFGMMRVRMPRVRIDDRLYDPGFGLDLQPGGDGDEGLTPPHIDTLRPLADWGIGHTMDYTAMAWVNFDNQTGDNMVFGQAGPPDPRLHLGARGADYWHGHWGDDIDSPVIARKTEPGTWRHVAWLHRSSDGAQWVAIDGVIQTGADLSTGGNANNPDPLGNLLIGTSGNGGSFRGQIDEVKVFTTLMTEPEIQAASVEGLAEVQLPAIPENGVLFGRDSVTIEIADFEEISVVDPATIALSVNGFVVTPSMVDKVGAVTTIVYDWPAGEPLWLTDYTFIVQGEDTGGEPFEDMRTIRSHALPAPGDFSGVPDASEGWIVQRWDTGVTLNADGVNAYRDVINNWIFNPVPVAPDLEETVPVINFIDPDTNGIAGVYNADQTFPGDQPGLDDNNFIICARTRITVPEPGGRYTFSLRSDDGYGFRVVGASFVRTAGDANNQIDALDPSTVVFPIPTGDSNARAICEFPAGGDYVLEYYMWENGGGAHAEVAWGPGDVDKTGGAPADWALVGNTEAPGVGPFTTHYVFGDVFRDKIGLVDGQFEMIWHYGAMRAGGTIGNVAQLAEYTRDDEAGTAFFTQETIATNPVINYRDFDNGGSGRHTAGELDFPEAPPGDNDNVFMATRFQVEIPEDGEYTFEVRSDDGFLLKFADPSVHFDRMAGNGDILPGALNELLHFAGTGDADTRGLATLTAGVYEMEFYWWEAAGGAHVELSAGAGNLLAGSSALVPVGAPRFFGINTTGPWTGAATDPEVPGGIDCGASPFLSGVIEAALGDVRNLPEHQWMADRALFMDPQTNGNGLPDWPRNTPGDDNNYAIEGEAVLDITQPGVYLIGFQGDDGTQLTVEGADFEVVETTVGALAVDLDFDGEFETIEFDGGSGDSRTVARTQLDVGQYPIRFAYYECGGGSFIKIWGARGEDALGTGAELPPIGPGAADQAFGGLRIVGAAPPALAITSIAVDPKDFTGDVVLTARVAPGATYALDVSQTMGAGSWVEIFDDLQSATDTLVVTLDRSTIDAVYGPAPVRTVFARLRLVAAP